LNVKIYYDLTFCRLCESTDLAKFLELIPTPAGNNFLDAQEKLVLDEPIFPLELYFCKNCYHVQLGHVVDPNHLFKNNYHFVSGTSPVNVNHFEKYADEIISSCNLKQGSLIIDVGSNDGTCLKSFQNRGMKVLGIDPAENIAKIANERGIKTIPSFFTPDLALSIKKEYGTPQLITSHNVLAHVENFSSIMDAISLLMDQDSIFIFEVGYFYDVFNNLWFDTIYHEHLDYHTVMPLEKFFKRKDMQLFHVEKVNIQGGSIRNFVQLKSGKNEVRDSVERIISDEISGGFDSLSKLTLFQARIDVAKTSLLTLIKEIKENNSRIAGYGAPTKSTTLMSYFELNSDLIEYIIDDNPLKQNKFSPKLHIPIVSSDYLRGESRPDYLLILAWNFAESIIERVKNNSDFDGGFIIPLPEARIV